MALKIGQIGLLATPVLAFAALAALVPTGPAGLREGLGAGQAEPREEMQARRAELRAGQIQLRGDLAALGVRLAVVEHGTDALEARLAAAEHHPTAPCEAVDCPGS